MSEDPPKHIKDCDGRWSKCRACAADARDRINVYRGKWCVICKSGYTGHYPLGRRTMCEACRRRADMTALGCIGFGLLLLAVSLLSLVV